MAADPALPRAAPREGRSIRPPHIYYKYEGVSPAGSHKVNTAIPQAYYNKAEGIRKLTTETGAGQWGSALSLACGMFELECEVFMVGVSYDQKPYRRAMIEAWGATDPPQPVGADRGGPLAAGEHHRLARHRDLRGGRARGRERGRPLLARLGARTCLRPPDGDRAGVPEAARDGGRVPRRRDRLRRRRLELRRRHVPLHPREAPRRARDIRFIAAEPAACPTLTKGVYAYDYGDTIGMTPLMPMYTLGHDFVPPPVHAGGLRYHGDASAVCALVKEGVVEAQAITQTDAFAAAVRFGRTEGILPAPEPSHAIKVAIDEALDAKEEGEERVILFNLCGHGYFDMAAYDQYHRGELEDLEFSEDDMNKALDRLPQAPALA